MIKTVKQNEKLSISNNLLEVNKYQSKLNQYKDFPKDVDCKFPYLASNIDKGKELSIEIGGYRVTLKQISQPSLSTDVSLLTTGIGGVRVIATIPTTYNCLCGVACLGEAEAWVYGKNKTITHIDIHGVVKNTVTTTCPYWPNGILVTRGRELIYSHDNSDTVTIVRDGKSQTLITAPKGWTPGGLCCTRSGDILVPVFKESSRRTENKIVRYKGNYIIQEISNDGRGNPIFKDGMHTSMFLSENNNGDGWVSDGNTGTVIVVDNDEHVCVPDANYVVVVDMEGRVRFRYDGTSAKRGMSFDPRGIVTDDLSQIIVADFNNECLHILDKNGHLLRCVDDCGLEELNGLSLDSEGKLWVGLEKSG
ncbi:uncharacterized protein LOC144624774 [Crassostrea virginica]